MESKANILHLGPRALQEKFEEWGEPAFRAKQVERWLWKQRVTDFDEMLNVSKPLRAKLKENYRIELPKLVTKQVSKDGTIKHLFLLEDNKTVETVWIPRKDQDRVTVCVSSQVGCRMGCTFCMTAQQKVERNLTAGEIVSQLLLMPEMSQITNVVLMGMGEPFDNFEEVMDSLTLMTNPDTLGIGPRKITVSTSGLVPKIECFLKETKCRLAISLNAPNNEIRSKIMPINRAYPIEKLLDGVKRSMEEMPSRPRDFCITWEYILIDEINDRPEHAHQLAKLLKGIPSKVNLLLYNENPNIDMRRPKEENVAAFRQILAQYGLLNFIRTSRGRDIAAACGQLASEHIRKEKPPLELDAHFL